MPENEMENLKTGVQVLGEIMKAAGDNPDVKQAASNLGKTAVTLTNTINTCLLPLAAVNFAVDKARAYFNGAFHEDLSKKASAIPLDQLVEPKASIAGPALQALAFSHEEVNLKEMYLNLLANAMDGRVKDSVHPSFVEIIKQISAEEARLLQFVLGTDALPTCRVQRKLALAGGFVVVHRHLLQTTDGAKGPPTIVPRLAAMVDNWIRLGLVSVDYTTAFTDGKYYDWIETRPEVIALQKEIDPKELDCGRGVMTRTDFGEQFRSSVGISVILAAPS